MAVDQNLKIELGKQGVFVTTIEELYNWGRRSSVWPMQFGLACCAIEMIATTMARYDPDGAITGVAQWSRTGAGFHTVSEIRLGGWNVPTLVFQTGRAARIDDQYDASGPITDAVRELGVRATVGVPVSLSTV